MRMDDLRRKDVINLFNGGYMGRAADLEFDPDTSQMKGIIIYGRLRWFGLLGREDDINIRWEDIEVIGDDSILVRYRQYGGKGRLPEPSREEEQNTT